MEKASFYPTSREKEVGIPLTGKANILLTTRIPIIPKHKRQKRLANSWYDIDTTVNSNSPIEVIAIQSYITDGLGLLTASTVAKVQEKK